MNRRWVVGMVCAVLAGCNRPAPPAMLPTGMDPTMTLPRLDSAIVPANNPNELESPGAGAFTPQPNDEDLEQEIRETNPLSETVLLKLSVSPPTKAVVMQGQKVMARLGPGAMEAEWTLPRNGGPLDLEIRSDGYLPFHTRLYSDRDDAIAVRLYRPGDAVGLRGYRPPSVGN